MSMRNWLYLLGLIMILSCKTDKKPCVSMSQVWGASLEGHDVLTYQNILQWVDSFVVKFPNGDNVPVVPNYTQSTFFLETQNVLNPVMYFRIKPSPNYDTIKFNGHLSKWTDGSCSGDTYILDSIMYNGRRLNPDNIFYYEQ